MEQGRGERGPAQVEEQSAEGQERVLYAYRSMQGMQLEHRSRINLMLLYVCMLAVSLAVSICCDRETVRRA